MYYSTNDLVVHGEIALPDGSAPQVLTMVERVCGGAVRNGGFADAKGHFSFNFGTLEKTQSNGSIVDTTSTSQLAQKVTLDDLRPCEIRVSLPGHRSQSIPLVANTNVVNTNAGTIVLKPAGSNPAPITSSKDPGASKNARKAFEKGMNAASRAKWKDALDGFASATNSYPEYVSAWISLGMLQEGGGDMAGALASYKKAMIADPKFALAHLHAAIASAALSQWPDVADEAGKVIAIDPESFPRAYFLSAIADLQLKHYEEAEKMAIAGLKVDPDRANPDLEYALGMALVGRNNRSGAVEHLRTYLSLAPQGGSARTAKQQLLMLGVVVE
jgi:hypothetical protein